MPVCLKGMHYTLCPRNYRLGCDCGRWKPLLNWTKIHQLTSRFGQTYWIRQGENSQKTITHMQGK